MAIYDRNGRRMNKKAVDACYKAELSILDVVRKFHPQVRIDEGGETRTPSFGKGPRNQSTSVNAVLGTFRSFTHNLGGDWVQYHYYMEHGDVISKDSGADSSYMLYKAQILGIDLYAPEEDEVAAARLQEVAKATKEFVSRPAPKKIEQSIRNSDEKLDAVNRLILQYLWQNKSRNLIYSHMSGRGMSQAEIEKSPYIMAPGPKDEQAITSLVDAKTSCALGTPGFYTQNGDLKLRVSTNGSEQTMLCPIFNVDHQLVAFHMRNIVNKNFSTYWALSSNGRENGTSPGTPTGYWGAKEPGDTVIITEGNIKGYLVHLWTRYPTLYLLGVSSQNAMRSTLAKVQKKGVKNLIIALDMDYKTNPAVLKAIKKLQNTAFEMGFEQFSLSWDSRYNGLDDWLFHLKKNNKMEKWLEENIVKPLNWLRVGAYSNN